MQTKLNKLILMLIFSAFVIGSWAVVSDYTFASAPGTYTEISEGTVLLSGVPADTNPSFNAIPLGFSFDFDGNAYTTVSVAENGFIALGDVVASSNLAISAATGTNNVIVAFNRDLVPRADGELMYLLSGTAPNRVFTVQWKNFRRVPTSTMNDILNFQIQLHEANNKIVFSYGNIVAVTVTTAQTVQVGLRGAGNDDYNNRTTLTDWTATTAGTANNSNCRLNADVYPPEGLTFSFSAAQQGAPPMPAQNPIPADLATNVSPNTSLSWITGGGATTGFKVYLGTDNPPTNLVDGIIQTETTYELASTLNYNTQYYWKVIPFNTDGDALDCPVWSFTTWMDPTITTYPYTQGFDTVTPPALPIGWSVLNENDDMYTWESFLDTNANTAPNVMRIRYSSTQNMDDWLISPPLQVTGEYAYKISFYYRANSASYPEKLALFKGNAANAAAMTEQLWANENITNSAYQLAEVIVPIAADGTIYLGFHGYSELNQFYLYLDSFSVVEMNEIMDPPTDLVATVSGNDVHLSWVEPGYTPPPPPDGFVDDFESYTDFSLSFDPWVLVDVDMATTYGMTGITWPNAYAAMAYMIYNPTATVPPVTDLLAHSGNKMAACFAATTTVNNDWMISPLVGVENGHFLNFWARSYTAEYGMERFKVGISTGGTAPANFTIISGASHVSAPEAWTLYSYDLSAYAGQDIRVGIQCVSNDAFIFLVDDVSIGDTPVRFEAPVASLNTRGSIARNIGTPIPAPAQRDITRDLLGYKVYRDGALINTIAGPATTEYDDMDLAVGSYIYTVTAYYDNGESDPAGPVTVQIISLTPPLDLAATVDGNDVSLAWTSPETPQEGEWISWSNNDASGNSIGTNAAAEFDVAHMYDATDLVAYQGGALTQLKFMPAYQNCVYTIKVWTGGTATTPGTMVYSAVADNITINEWNLHVLNTPVAVPTDRLWIGYGVNTQGGHPAGCDDGPVIEGKGNIMNFGGWTTLTQLAETLTYNWLIQGFVATNTTLKALTPVAIVESPLSTPQGTLSANRFEPNRSSRALLGFKVYRDGDILSTISDPAITTYTDMDVPNGDYLYGVTAMYSEGESAPATVNVNVNLVLAPVALEDGFEEYADFATEFGHWTLIDQDNSDTYGFTGIVFPGSGSPMAYIIFNPSQTVPPITDVLPHAGNKMAASFAAVTAPNKDMLITRRINLGTNSSVKFYARSHTTNYGMERFKVGVSTMPVILPQGFQYITGADDVQVPASWTEYIYDLSAYNGQDVYIAIRCTSNDAFVFYVDDFSVHTGGGSDAGDVTAPVYTTELKGNYPNPFNPETTIRFSTKEAGPVALEIYNVKGQLVKKLVNEDKAAGNHTVVWNGTDLNNRPVSTGVYFYKMNAGKYSSTKKMIMMK
ncbi:MAG: choice-of-anchor J domain-containing protein [Candidatus Cloacimonetes bacterium]|jgi:hypothetical protein|nr:choice-of-anchor J domain-containing protein [Candidatus Cloacimonadota bacterium]MDY0326402.1 choice-of-anchor J domain-containing protein [Candidatus Cloacimonadaceae bacterium]